MSRTRTAVLFAWALSALSPPASLAAQETLDVYLIDVEGGGATLFVSPGGESLLIDTGNGGANAERDAGRIVAAMEDAGVTALDHLLTTHWHGDHYGAMEALAGRVPIGNYIDHGPTVESSETALRFLEETYPALYGRAGRTIVEPGDGIGLAGVDVTVLASARRVIRRPLPGGGAANPYCAGFVPREEDTGENAQSVGILVTHGAFRLLHLGDLTWNTEFELMCPNNPVGEVDLFVVSHHGQPSSNARVLVHAIEPRVGIMNNGTRKTSWIDLPCLVYRRGLRSRRAHLIWRRATGRRAGQCSNTGPTWGWTSTRIRLRSRSHDRTGGSLSIGASSRTAASR